jgi:putative transposase
MQASNKGLALGNEHFIGDIEAITGKSLSEDKRDRSLRWRKGYRANLEG